MYTFLTGRSAELSPKTNITIGCQVSIPALTVYVLRGNQVSHAMNVSFLPSVHKPSTPAPPCLLAIHRGHWIEYYMWTPSSAV